MEALINYLNSISPLTPKTNDALRSLFTPSLLQAGDYFAAPGAPAYYIGFLQKGVVRAYFVDDAGKEYNKQFFVGPTLIGAYSALLTQQPTRVAQQALTDCEAWQVSYSQIEALYTQFHDLERLGRKIAERYFLEKEKKELEMALLDAEKRYLIFQQEFSGLQQRIPQYHIASYLGISATQLSRIRKKMASS